MESRTKNKRRYNALKHGVFSSEPIIQDERWADFDQLHRQCIEDFKPSGRAEKEVVLTIAQYMWRKHRGARFFAQQATWIQTHPDMEKLPYVDNVCSVMKQTSSPAVAWDLAEQLPNPFRGEFRKRFNRPPTDAGPAWIEAFVKYIQAWAV